MSELDKEVDLFNMDTDDSTLDFLNKKEKNNDGIYRPKLESAKDPKKGYISTLRFLPNLSKEGKVGVSAIEKHIHYVNLPNNEDLRGYYDCAKNYTDKCEICTMFWKFHNSKNAADVEKAELIKRSTKYYSYVLIVEDENQPELEGKILIYPYGYKIKEKINDEKNGVADEKCNIFDLANGKDFRLVIKKVGEFSNYDSSTFLKKSAIKISGKEVPTSINEASGKNSIVPKFQAKLRSFLLEREVELDDNKAKEWDDETKGKVSKIISVISGDDIDFAETSIKNTSKGKNSSIEDDEVDFTETKSKTNVNDDVESFFDLDDEE